MALTNEELARLMEEVNYELDRFGKMTAGTADRLRDAKVGVEGFSNAVREAPKQIGKAAGQMAGAMYRGEQGAKAFNSSIDSMADAASAATTVLSALIPGGPVVKLVVAGLAKLATVAIKTGAELQKAAGAQGDALLGTYRKLAEVGAAGGDGLQGLADDAKIAGQNILDMGHYASLISEGSQDLAQYAGTVTEGRKRFAEINAELFKSGEKLERLGLNTDAQATAAMGYLKLQQRLGFAQTQSTENLGKAAVRYIEEQDRLTKITGLTREQQEKDLEAAMRNQRFSSAIDTLRDENNEKAAKQMLVFNELLGKLGPVTQKGFQDMAAGLGLTSEEAARAFTQSGGALMDAVNKIRSGTVKDDRELALLYDQVRKNMATFNKEIGRASAGLGVFDQNTGGAYEEGRRAELQGTESLATVLNKATAAVNAQIKGEDKLLATQTDTAQKQRKTMVNQQELMQLAVQTAADNVNKLATAAEAASEALLKIAGARKPKPVVTGGTEVPAAPPPVGGVTGKTYSGAAGGPIPGYGTPTPQQAMQLGAIRDLIGKVESDSSGGYNAVAGGVYKGDLTNMTVGEVKQLQRQLMAQGKGSAAMGRYQFIASTLSEIVGKVGIKDEEKFDQAVQDKLADFLITTRGGYATYARNPDDPETKKRMMQALAGIWRGLPNEPGMQKGMPTDPEARNPNLTPEQRAKYKNKAGMSWDEAYGSIPNFSKGGIANMPKTGSLANLHGTEAVVPLPDGKNIPVVVKTDFSDLRKDAETNVDRLIGQMAQTFKPYDLEKIANKIAEAKQPKINAEELASAINIDKITEKITQGIKIPEVKIPEVKISEVKIPEIKVPEIKQPIVDIEQLNREITTVISNRQQESQQSPVDMDKLSAEITSAVQNAANSIASNLQFGPILAALEEISRYQKENVSVNERMLRNTIS